MGLERYHLPMATDLITIRSARVEDAEALASAHADAWRLAYRGVIPHLHLERMVTRRGKKWWAAAIKRRAPVMVLQYDGDAVGYTTFGRSRMRHTPYQGEIFEIYVSPVYQGLGFGTRLFRTARSALQDARLNGLVIWALADNEIACNFYLSLGGQPISQGAETYGKTTLRKIAFGWN